MTASRSRAGCRGSELLTSGMPRWLFEHEQDAVAATADFDLDQNFTGTFTSDFSASLDGSDNGFSSVSSHLFVGGGEDSSWDDLSVTVFTVVPEPSSALLLGTGLAFLAARRRLR